MNRKFSSEISTTLINWKTLSDKSKIFTDMNIFKNLRSGIIFLIIAGFFANCEKQDTDIPPIAIISPDSILTLGEIRDMIVPGETFTFSNTGQQLFATVTMDERNGNIYRQAYIQDNTGAINLRMALTANLKVGDSIRVSLDGSSISYFNNMLQLDSVNGPRQIVKQAEGKFLEPAVVTIDDIKSGGYQAQLVKLENVQFLESELDSTWADAINLRSINRTLQDCDNNTIIVRTSGYADFANEKLPSGNGDFIGIVGQFGQVWQLYVRDPNELGMDNERCIIDTGETGSGTFEDPYNVAHAYNNNTGNNVWVQGYIIGVMETDVDPFAPNFNPPFRTNSNIIIADSPDETNMNNALIIQLPFGSSPRAALNLVDNPQRLGVFVKLKGNLAAYFGVPGMRDTSDYWLEDDDDPVDPDLPDPVTFIDEDFQSYPNHSIIDNYGWTAYAETGSRYWICRTFQENHYAQATAHNSTDDSNIMWMITPPIDLDAMTNPTFEFESAKAFYTHDGFSLHISTNFDGVNVTDADWQTLDAILAGQGDPDNTWIHSGFLDLSSYSGIVHIAWKYVSSAPQGNTGTFRVDNVKLYEAD